MREDSLICDKGLRKLVCREDRETNVLFITPCELLMHASTSTSTSYAQPSHLTITARGFAA